ncbi:MAG: ABC transporter ATP-binding protein/permease [Cryomorphaceae bacterium]|nr:ABC transporter ATP-binding protein/permease [Cryomorphaceae bacterium]
MKSLSHLNKYFLKYKWRFLLGIVFIVISNYFGVKMPIYLKDSIDSLLTGTQFDSSEWMNQTLLLALKLGGIYMLLSLCSGFFLFLMRQTIIIMSRLIEYDLKNEIYQKYQELDLMFYKRNNTGDLMNRISEDVSQVRMYLGPGIMYTLNLIALFILVLYQMIAISPILTLFVLLPLPLMSFMIYKVSSTMNLMSKNVQKEQSFMSTLVQESFSGIRVVKAFSRENIISEKFNNSAKDYHGKYLSLVKVNALFMPTIVFLIGLSTILTIYLGGLMAQNQQVTLGEILAFIFFVNKLTWPFASIGWVTSINQRAAASQSRINEFLHQKPDISSPTSNEFNLKGKLELKNVSLTYQNSGITALKNVNFSISPGEFVAIVGRTGSGKTSLVQLITRQIDPTSGQILIDQQNLKDINLSDFRKQTGSVTQDVFLFSDTISNNIAFGITERKASKEEIEQAAIRAHVHHNIVEFQDGYETLLGERGINLSGGQKQRVSIARALIRKPKLLILDDCLSAVDTETEDVILNSLKENLAKGTTCIMVSHRISSTRMADRILVLEEGHITEDGTHEQLLSKNGSYAEMYYRQLSEDSE